MGPNLEGLRALAADPAGSAQRLAFLPWVAGCAVAGITDGTIDVAAAGIADLEQSTPVEPGTRFRPGSTTKLVTATIAMQCVEDGLCALDDPVVRFIPELDLADSDRMERVTIRHLLSHSSGIDAGDFFVDTGDDDDCRAATSTRSPALTSCSNRARTSRIATRAPSSRDASSKCYAARRGKRSCRNASSIYSTCATRPSCPGRPRVRTRTRRAATL